MRCCSHKQFILQDAERVCLVAMQIDSSCSKQPISLWIDICFLRIQEVQRVACDILGILIWIKCINTVCAIVLCRQRQTCEANSHKWSLTHFALTVAGDTLWPIVTCSRYAINSHCIRSVFNHLGNPNDGLFERHLGSPYKISITTWSVNCPLMRTLL